MFCLIRTISLVRHKQNAQTVLVSVRMLSCTLCLCYGEVDVGRDFILV